MNQENLNSKSKLSVVSDILANARKELESFKIELNDFKSGRATFKNILNSLNNEFYEYAKGSLEVSDKLILINNETLMTKSESYINIENRHHAIKNNTLIISTKCIKFKSVIRENVKSLKNIKNNLYSVKKDTDSILIDLKKLKEEFINNSNKRMKTQFIIINAKIKTNKVNHSDNKPSSKINVACTIKDSAIVKNHVGACTSTDDLIAKNHVDVCTSTDDLIVKNHVDVFTSTDDVCTNENEPCTSKNDDRDSDSEDDDSDIDN